MTRLAAVAAVSLLAFTPACAMSSGGKTGLTIAGVGTTVAGALLYSTAERTDLDGNGANDTILDDNWIQMGFGTTVTMLGLGMLIAGLTAHTTHTERAVLTPDPPTAAAVWGQPSLAAPSTTAVADETALPALPLADDELRLALQALSLTRAHHCDAAGDVVGRLAITNPDYARAMRVQILCVAAP